MAEIMPQSNLPTVRSPWVHAFGDVKKQERMFVCSDVAWLCLVQNAIVNDLWCYSISLDCKRCAAVCEEIRFIPINVLGCVEGPLREHRVVTSFWMNHGFMGVKPALRYLEWEDSVRLKVDPEGGLRSVCQGFRIGIETICQLSRISEDRRLIALSQMSRVGADIESALFGDQNSAKDLRQDMESIAKKDGLDAWLRNVIVDDGDGGCKRGEPCASREQMGRCELDVFASLAVAHAAACEISWYLMGVESGLSVARTTEYMLSLLMVYVRGWLSKEEVADFTWVYIPEIYPERFIVDVWYRFLVACDYVSLGFEVMRGRALLANDGYLFGLVDSFCSIGKMFHERDKAGDLEPHELLVDADVEDWVKHWVEAHFGGDWEASVGEFTLDGISPTAEPPDLLSAADGRRSLNRLKAWSK